MQHPMIDKAGTFQRAAHSACGQFRKHDLKPYHTHPEAVMALLVAYVDPAELTWEMCAAALLHDAIEDTAITFFMIQDEFGSEVARLVEGCTNRKWRDPETGNPVLKRAFQKELDARRLSATCKKTKTIKLADCLHNLSDIIVQDPKFAKVFVAEKRFLIDSALYDGNQVLWSRVDKLICDYYAENALQEA